VPLRWPTTTAFNAQIEHENVKYTNAATRVGACPDFRKALTSIMAPQMQAMCHARTRRTRGLIALAARCAPRVHQRVAARRAADPRWRSGGLASRRKQTQNTRAINRLSVDVAAGTRWHAV
jgi:hypothetical protein